jgi:hypothetical protein
MERHIAVRRYAMKLRIKGNSLRLRVTPSEIMHLLRYGGIREHVQLTPNPDDRLTYAVISSLFGPRITVTYEFGDITVNVPEIQLRTWARGDDVGVYADVALGDEVGLSVAIEKDFACLDRSDAENEDTFPNPNLAAAC